MEAGSVVALPVSVTGGGWGRGRSVGGGGGSGRSGGGGGSDCWASGRLLCDGEVKVECRGRGSRGDPGGTRVENEAAELPGEAERLGVEEEEAFTRGEDCGEPGAW